MADIKWIKITTNMPEDEKMKINRCNARERYSSLCLDKITYTSWKN